MTIGMKEVAEVVAGHPWASIVIGILWAAFVIEVGRIMLDSWKEKRKPSSLDLGAEKESCPYCGDGEMQLWNPSEHNGYLKCSSCARTGSQPPGAMLPRG